MANPEHVKTVTQGSEAIRRWRQKHPLAQFDLRDTNLSGVDLREANLCGANLDRADLSMAKLSRADLSGADLDRADLSEADLSDANLTAADMVGANLTGATLTVANLYRAELNSANLSNANLSGTRIISANLSSANLSGSLCFYTIFVDLDLSDVRLDTVRHLGPSTVGVDTLLKSNGKIPEIFLRGCGVPERLIELLPSLIGTAIEFYTCFISYTEADDSFSERLYNDLQGAGVRCWRWKEDGKWGKTFMRSVDEAIRVYDKLVVICSENSLRSPTVLREIERALQKEDDLCRQGKEADVLFPIRLDDYLFDGWEHERKADVVKKHVGDFRQWNDPQSYKKALDHLIRDLRAEKSPEDET